MLEPTPIPSVRAVLLVAREGEAALEATRGAAEWLRAQGIEVQVSAEVAYQLGGRLPEGCHARDLTDMSDDVDLAVALGGDGTLLRIAHYVGDLPIPVMGVNLGRLGFLAAFGAGQLAESLRAAAAGELVWEPRLRMRVEVVRDGSDDAWVQIGCNDAYVKHGEQPRMLDLATTIGGRKIAEYRADGLIVCTPMGSTAYNLSAGGPIVDNGTDTFTITPICPHSLTHRPVVTSARRTIGITYVGPSDAGHATLSVDGLWGRTLKIGDEVKITRAPAPLRLVPPNATVFDVLTAKLGWSVPGAPRAT